MTTSPLRNRESIIGVILRREHDGLPINCEAIKEASMPLYCGAVRHFGSWRNALRAAGIDVPRVEHRREWNKAKIITTLRALCRQGLSLRQRDVYRRDSGLCRAACLAFGTWCNALIAAGINPEPICRDLQWDQNEIIEAILMRVIRDEPLGSTTVRPHTLKRAAVREFGSWPSALTAAGLDPAQYIRRRAIFQADQWTRERVRKAILLRHTLGMPLYGNSVLREDRPLFAAARRCFVRWSEALVFAGFDPAEHNGNRR
jgi:hypothetical protein